MSGIPNHTLSLWAFLAWAGAVSLAHAGLPTHWLPFVLVGRSRGWSRPRILATLLLAGLGHMAITALLGVGAFLLGHALLGCAQGAEKLAGLPLILIGLLYLGVGFWGHNRLDCAHDLPARMLDRASVAALFVMLTLSPCEVILPAFFVAGRWGWQTILGLILVTSTVTLAVMLISASLVLAGLARLRLTWLVQREHLLVGALLIGMGLFLSRLDGFFTQPGPETPVAASVQPPG